MSVGEGSRLSAGHASHTDGYTLDNYFMWGLTPGLTSASSVSFYAASMFPGLSIATGGAKVFVATVLLFNSGTDPESQKTIKLLYLRGFGEMPFGAAPFIIKDISLWQQRKALRDS